MDTKELEKNGLEMSIGSKIIKVKGAFVGNLFCVDKASIDNNSLLTKKEKESIKEELCCNKNILLSD